MTVMSLSLLSLEIYILLCISRDNETMRSISFYYWTVTQLLFCSQKNQSMRFPAFSFFLFCFCNAWMNNKIIYIYGHCIYFTIRNNIRWMSQLVASVPINGSFVCYSILYKYFTIRADVFFFNLNSVNFFLSTRYCHIIYNYNCCVKYEI